MSGMLDDAEGVQVLNDDVQKLREAWVAECTCPDILSYQFELVDDIKALVKNQEDVLEDIERTPEQHLSLSLYLMDVDRMKFALAKYLRTRLLKLEKWAWAAQRSPDLRAKLSEPELSFVDRYTEAMARHYQDAALRHLPEAFQDFPDKGRSVAPEDFDPNTDTYVFAKVRPDAGVLEIEDAVAAQAQGDGGHTTLQPGEVHVLRYPSVKGLVGHQVDLL